MRADLATSRYTFRLPLSEGYALFNASTGSVLRLQGTDAAELSALLSGPRTLIPRDALGGELTARLRRNGFLVDPGFFDPTPPPHLLAILLPAPCAGAAAPSGTWTAATRTSTAKADSGAATSPA